MRTHQAEISPFGLIFSLTLSRAFVTLSLTITPDFKVEGGGYLVGGARAPAEGGPLSLVQNVLGQNDLYI